MLSTTLTNDIGANWGKLTRCHARSSSEDRSSESAQCGLTHASSSEASSIICPSGAMLTRLRPLPVQITTLVWLDPKTVTRASDTFGASMAHTSSSSAVACATTRIRRLSLVTGSIYPLYRIRAFYTVTDVWHSSLRIIHAPNNVPLVLQMSGLILSRQIIRPEFVATETLRRQREVRYPNYHDTRCRQRTLQCPEQ